MSQQFNQNGQPIIVNVQNTNTVFSPSQMVSQKNKWITFLLCLFLGVLGFHRFYVGKIGTGILYLLTGGFMGIGVLIDCIVILVGSFKDKYGYRIK